MLGSCWIKIGKSGTLRGDLQEEVNLLVPVKGKPSLLHEVKLQHQNVTIGKELLGVVMLLSDIEEDHQ
jgi:hypothetical protein